MTRRAFGARFYRGTGRKDRDIGGTSALIDEVSSVPPALDAARRGQRHLAAGTALFPVSIGVGSALGVIGLFCLLVPIIPTAQSLVYVASAAVIGGGGVALARRKIPHGHDALGDAVSLYNTTLAR
jgi:hypothetical protein